MINKTRDSPPLDLNDLITEQYKQELEDLQNESEGKEFYDSKFSLWQNMLSGAGMTPEVQSLKAHKLFCHHTLLVVLSRLLIAVLEGREESLEKIVGSDFPAWLLSVPKERGHSWLVRLHKEFMAYEWRRATGDVLRAAYEDLIDKSDRKLFGEHYTPLWLAEAICERVMDKAWCLGRGILYSDETPIVLDPACGSGTFLYAACKRLDRSLQEGGLIDAQVRADRIVRRVYGIDLHPVAVEMSVATVLMALPTLPVGGRKAVHVYQGDSMQLRTDSDKELSFIPISQSRVDRLVGNPPWVVLNHIPDVVRQDVMKRQAMRLGLWAGGKDASRTDIASIFVHRCFELYAAPHAYCGWVFPYAALKGNNWAKFRVRGLPNKSPYTETWNLSKVKKPVFTGASSCVYLYVDETAEETSHYDWHMDGVMNNDSWEQAKKNLTLSRSVSFLHKKSHYAHYFKDGASIIPYVLVLGRFQERTFTTYPSNKGGWHEVSPLSDEVDVSYTLPVRRAEALIPFYVLPASDRVLWPFDDTGLLRDPCPPLWEKVCKIWEQRRKAKSPKCLEERVDRLKLLSKQLPLESLRCDRRVIYNKSGSWVCASRLCGEDVILHDSLHYAVLDTVEEACYLTALLNADALQAAFRQARQSDRHFCDHIWDVVPIPRYNASDEVHRELVSLCQKAEKVVMESRYVFCTNERSVRSKVREVLRNTNVMGYIDVAAQRLLPHHVSTPRESYSVTIPVPEHSTLYSVKRPP